MFGTFDRDALRRGFQVYNEVCQNCHSLKLIAYRDLRKIGFSEDEVKAIAASKEVQAGPNDDGEMYMRPATPADHFVPPFPNDNAAKAANGGALPPDLSLIIKARKNGPDYVRAILNGYADLSSDSEKEAAYEIVYHARMEEYESRLVDYEAAIAAGRQADKPTPPAKVSSADQLGLADGMNFNVFFKGFGIAMPEPLSADAVTYADGTKATVAQMSHDVVTFLAWTASPELEARKRLGVKVMIFLLVLTALMYALKRKIWEDVH